MPLYFCECCNFKTQLKGNYKMHLNTVKHKKLSTNYDNKPFKNNENVAQMSTNIAQMSTNEHKSSSFPSSKIICKYCDKTFKTKPNLKRHIKMYCKQIKETETIDLKKKIEMMESKHEKEKNELYKKIEQLINKVGNTTNNITHNTQNIILNNYGNEDLSHISDKLKSQLIKIPYAMIPKMIEAVHFNEAKPENNNIQIPNKKDNLVKIYSNNKWIYKDKEQTLNDLVDGKYNILDNFYEYIQNNENLSPFVKMNYLKFRKYYDEGDKEIIEQLKKDSELIILNNR